MQKYFYDSLEIIEGENFIISSDIISMRSLDNWIKLNFMERTTGNKIRYHFQFVIATRQDDEGYILDALEEKIDKYIYGDAGGNRAISFYDISNLPNLTEIGKIHLRPQRTSNTFNLDDRTKARIIDIIAYISTKAMVN